MFSDGYALVNNVIHVGRAFSLGLEIENLKPRPLNGSLFPPFWFNHGFTEICVQIWATQLATCTICESSFSAHDTFGISLSRMHKL